MLQKVRFSDAGTTCKHGIKGGPPWTAKTATSQAYLKAVKPKAAIIMCGKDNTVWSPA